MTPQVTVLIPARNAERWISESVLSLTQQTYLNLEILLVDDGSTDRTVALAREVGGGLLRVIPGEGQGVANALALGIRECATDIVLRHDADDIAEPNRVERQVDYLMKNPDCVLLGTDATLIDANGAIIGRVSHPHDHSAITLRMCLMTAFTHPSVAFRRSAVLEAGNYRSPNYEPFAEDFDLWSRLEMIGTIANLPEPMLRYRISPGSVTESHWSSLAKSAGAIAATNLARHLGMTEVPHDMQKLVTFFHLRNRRITIAEMIRLETWLIQARHKSGFRHLPGAFTWDIYARPISWMVRQPRNFAS